MAIICMAKSGMNSREKHTSLGHGNMPLNKYAWELSWFAFNLW